MTAQLSPNYNTLTLILTEILPDDIVHNIIIMVYGMEHIQKVDSLRLNHDIKAYALSFETIRSIDPQNACKFWHNCRCCKAHQINKGLIFHNGAPAIITRPIVFNPNAIYWGNVPPTPRFHNQAHIDNHNGARCYCHCRHWTRECVRTHVANLYGPKNENNYYLHIEQHHNPQHHNNDIWEDHEYEEGDGYEGLGLFQGGGYL